MEADSIRKIDVHFLKNNGYFSSTRWGTLRWTSSFSGYDGSASLESVLVNDVKYLRIRCSVSEYGMEESYTCEIVLTTTPCYYGGKRYWMLCPSWGCRRRVGTLYFVGGRFACRHCFNLTYSTQNQSKRHSGFISIPLLAAMEATVKRTHYRSRPTRKYRRYLKMQTRFLRDVGWVNATLGARAHKNHFRKH